MDTHNCQFCAHANTADAKYCSECGGCLYLVPCPSCGVVNDVKAGSCYQCQGSLQAGAGDAPEHRAPVAMTDGRDGPDFLARAVDAGKFETAYPLSPIGEVVHPPARRRTRTIAGTALIAVIAVLGYYGYRQHATVNANQTAAAGSETRTQASPASSGVIRQDAVPLESAPAKAAGAALTAPAGSAPAEVQTIAANKGSKGAGASASACSDTSVTLGLCATAPAQKKAVESAANNAVTLRPDAADTNQGSSTAACPEATAALGLCAAAASTVPAITHTQRKE